VRPPTKELPREIASAQGAPPLAVPFGRKSKRFRGRDFCEQIIHELTSKKHRPYAWPFYAPVDAQALGIWDYHTIIAKPMDLGTVKDNLENGVYTAGGANAFIEDIRTIFANCYQYNPPGDATVALARQTQAEFEKLLQKMPAAVGEDTDSGPAGQAPAIKRAKAASTPGARKSRKAASTVASKDAGADTIQKGRETSGDTSRGGGGGSDTGEEEVDEVDEDERQRMLMSLAAQAMMLQLDSREKQKKKKNSKAKNKKREKKAKIARAQHTDRIPQHTNGVPIYGVWGRLVGRRDPSSEPMRGAYGRTIGHREPGGRTVIYGKENEHDRRALYGHAT